MAHLSKQPGLAALGVQVGMAAEEWVEGCHLVPPSQQLCVWIAKEAAHIGACTQPTLQTIWFYTAQPED